MERDEAARRERAIIIKVRSRLETKLKEIEHNQGRYTSKAYRAYLDRLRVRYVERPPKPNADGSKPDKFAALGEALADHMFEMMHRPSCIRILFQPEHPSVVEWRADLAEVDRRVTAILATVLPYNRKTFYDNKCVGYIDGISSVPYAKYETNFVEPTKPFPEQGTQ